MATQRICWIGILVIAFLAVTQAQIEELPSDIKYPTSCACPKISIQDEFCKSDFGEIWANITGQFEFKCVIQAEVGLAVSVMVNGEYYIRYTVKIITWFKWEYCLNEIYIFTPRDCAITPVYGKKYVFMGMAWHGYMRVDRCDWWRMWSSSDPTVVDLTSFQRKALKKGVYEKRCPCIYRVIEWAPIQITEVKEVQIGK